MDMAVCIVIVVWYIRPSWVLPRALFAPDLYSPSIPPSLLFSVLTAVRPLIWIGERTLARLVRPELVAVVIVAFIGAYLIELYELQSEAGARGLAQPPLVTDN